jgi:hypothetical protein
LEGVDTVSLAGFWGVLGAIYFRGGFGKQQQIPRGNDRKKSKGKGKGNGKGNGRGQVLG